MIKCGTIAALVIAGSAAGTATLVSNPPGAESASAGGQAAIEQAITARGTRSETMTLGATASRIGDQPRRGERSEYEPDPLAMVATSYEEVRRGTR